MGLLPLPSTCSRRDRSAASTDPTVMTMASPMRTPTPANTANSAVSRSGHGSRPGVNAAGRHGDPLQLVELERLGQALGPPGPFDAVARVDGQPAADHHVLAELPPGRQQPPYRRRRMATGIVGHAVQQLVAAQVVSLQPPKLTASRSRSPVGAVRAGPPAGRDRREVAGNGPLLPHPHQPAAGRPGQPEAD